MTYRNRELVPDRSWSRLDFGSEGRYSEHSGVCRRTEQPGRSVNVKIF